jgi:hypothetical protein
VPKGFVTDLASIPRPFWSLLPPNGPYAQAAIVHDYLYWMQTGTKLAADETLKTGMQDLEVRPFIVNIIFWGVRSPFGDLAWNNDAKQRRAGESRLLLKFPTDPAIKWVDWKRQNGNLVRGG